MSLRNPKSALKNYKGFKILNFSAGIINFPETDSTYCIKNDTYVNSKCKLNVIPNVTTKSFETIYNS